MRQTAMSGDFVKGLSGTLSEDIVSGLCQGTVRVMLGEYVMGLCLVAMSGDCPGTLSWDCQGTVREVHQGTVPVAISGD